MKQDLKDSTFSFKEKKRKKNKQRFRLIALSISVVLLIILLSAFMAATKCRRLEKMLLKGQAVKAGPILSTIKHPFLNKRTKILEGIMALVLHQNQKASDILNKIESPGSTIDHTKFMHLFLGNGDYAEAGIYLEFLKKGKTSYNFFESALYTARFQPLMSEKIINTINYSKLDNTSRKKISLLQSLNKKLKQQRIEYIFDRNQIALAAYDLTSKRTISFTPGLYFDEFTDRIKTSGIRLFTLSLDMIIQKKLDRLFRGSYGSFILLDLNDSSIRAAYSKSSDNRHKNSVFTELQAPGSIVKILTLYAYLLHPKENLFPFYCQKPLTFDNKLFYDWTAHGKVNSFTEALSLSCNHSFAKMAISVGQKNIYSIFNKFLFNHEPIQDRFLKFTLGSYRKNVSQYDFVRQVVGLPPLKATTFHSAFYTAIITMNGSLNSPFLIKNIKNIFNVPFYNHKKNLLTFFKNTNLQFLRIKEAMLEVVNSPKGTGRRSKVDFVQTAIKTGTIGSKKRGLDSVLIGFFPADHPKYVFAFRLNNAGRAEFAAALFLKKFLTVFFNR
jgi:hypothetical protein